MVWCVEPFVVCVYVCMYVPARGARGPRCRRAASSSRPSSGGAAPRTCVDFVYMCKCIGLYKRMFVCGSLDRSIHPSIEPSICPRIQHALNTHAPDVPEGDGGGRRTLQRIAAAVAIRHAPPAAPPVPPAPPVGEVAVDEEAEGSVFVLCLRDAWVWMGSVYVETGRGRATTHGHCFCLLTRCCSGQERLS